MLIPPHKVSKFRFQRIVCESSGNTYLSKLAPQTPPRAVVNDVDLMLLTSILAEKYANYL